MFRGISSIRLKVVLLILLATMAALLVAGAVLVAYDVRSHRESWARDLTIQAEIVGRTCAPALVFGDTLTAHQTLTTLSVRPEIQAAAVYDAQGRIFASYARAGHSPRFPPLATAPHARFDRTRFTLSWPITDLDGRVGTVFLEARYDMTQRLANYLPVVLFIGITGLMVATAMSYRLQSAVTKPVLAIADVAREVRSKRDFSLRVRKETRDETGQLVDAFNAMLAEVAEAHDTLLHSNQRKDEFLATLAHELRNPLGPIQNAVQYLRLKGVDPGATRSLELIERQVQHMVRLIEDLLDISRITRDALELRLSEFTVRELVEDVVEATRYAAEEAQQEMVVRTENPNVRLHADRARLVQVVCNLVNNAIKYTPRGGRIELSASSQRRDLILTVSDDGIGIPPDRLSDIFEPFSQIDRSLEKTRGGLGIGLALSQRLVALHGGTISASSEGLGRGSRFEVSLPIVSDALAPTPHPKGDRQEHATARALLVADDNLDGAESLAALLGAMGHRVQVAHDGEQAYEMLAVSGFDAAVLDIGMPRLNGYDLCRRVRQQPWGQALLLIALTGWGQVEDKNRAYEAGFDFHLTKPVRPEQLLAALAALDSPSAQRG